jgi:hypothetical protein
MFSVFCLHILQVFVFVLFIHNLIFFLFISYKIYHYPNISYSGFCTYPNKTPCYYIKVTQLFHFILRLKNNLVLSVCMLVQKSLDLAFLLTVSDFCTILFHSFSNLSDDRSNASSKTVLFIIYEIVYSVLLLRFIPYPYSCLLSRTWTE